MANVINYDDLEDKKQNQGQPPQPGASGQGNQSAQNQSGGNQQNTNQYKPDAYSKQRQGTGYTNIGRVIQANQGNRLAQAVTGNVQHAGEQAKANVQQAGQQFQQQTQANRLDTDANQQVVQNVLADPTQYVGAEDQNNPLYTQGSQFGRLISGEYAGPQGLANAPQLQAQVGGVKRLGEALGSSGGQIGLLQQTVGGNNYGSGKQNLDQLLLAKSGGDELGRARRQALGLGNIFGTQQAGAQAVGQEMAGRAQEVGKNVQSQFGQALATQDTALQDLAKRAQDERNVQFQKTMAALQSGKITQEQADMLGLTQGQEVTGDIMGKLGSFVSENQNKATAQNVASAQDYAKIDALRKLAGQYAPEDAQKLLQSYSGQNEQAQTFKPEDAIQADKGGFQNALQAQMTEYKSKLEPVQQQLDSFTELSNLVAQRDRLAGPGQSAANKSEANRIQETILQRWPGAGGASGKEWTKSDWVKEMLRQSQQKYNQTTEALQNAYGGIQNVKLLPKEPLVPIQSRPVSLMGPNMINSLNDNPNAFKVR